MEMRWQILVLLHLKSWFCPGYYDKVLEILPTWITRIMIVGSVHHGPESRARHTVSWDYFAKVVDYFEEAGTRRNFTVGTRVNCAPDDDFMFMANAKWCGGLASVRSTPPHVPHSCTTRVRRFVPGGGGFGELLGQVVHLLGGTRIAERHGSACGNVSTSKNAVETFDLDCANPSELSWDEGGRLSPVQSLEQQLPVPTPMKRPASGHHSHEHPRKKPRFKKHNPSTPQEYWS